MVPSGWLAATSGCHNLWPLRSFSHGYLHVHRTFIPETDKTVAASAILSSTCGWATLQLGVTPIGCRGQCHDVNL